MTSLRQMTSCLLSLILQLTYFQSSQITRFYISSTPTLLAHHTGEAELQPKVSFIISYFHLVLSDLTYSIIQADDDYYVLHGAFSASDSRCGPMLDICLDLLLCEKSGDKYHSSLLEDFTSSDFYDYQIVGAVGLLLKLVGRIDGKRYSSCGSRIACLSVAR